MSFYNNFKPQDDYLNMLMSSQGQKMLDKEIMKMKQQIGQNEFINFAREYFKGNLILTPQITNNQSQKVQILPQRQEQQIVVPENQQRVCSTIPQEQNEDHLYLQIQRIPLQDNKFQIKYNNGDIYEGQFENQMKSGWGQYYYASGQKYVGCFIEDQIHGYGRYYFLSGANFQGDWYEGMKHGYGILKFANKDEYSGHFSEDEFSGEGVYQYNNGDIFEGVWKKGKRQGKGVFKGIDGRIQIGYWKNDQFDV